MRYAACICVLALAACGSDAEVDVRNASVEDVAREVGEASGSGNAMIRPGKWESTMKMEAMEAPGMSEAARSAMRNLNQRNATYSSCLTPDQVRKPKEDFFAGATRNCRYDHFTMGGGKIDARMRCTHQEMDQVMEMSGTYSPESYSMVMTTRAETPGPVGAMTMRMRVDARRVGECDGKEG